MSDPTKERFSQGAYFLGKALWTKVTRPPPLSLTSQEEMQAQVRAAIEQAQQSKKKMVSLTLIAP